MGPVVLWIAGLAAVLGGLARLGRRAHRGGPTGSVIAIFDEIWHPARYRSNVDVQRQVERRAPSAAPSEPPDLSGARPVVIRRNRPRDTS